MTPHGKAAPPQQSHHPFARALTVLSSHRPMPSARRFPPPWTIEEHNDACFIVKDATGQALGYFYFEEEPALPRSAVAWTLTN